MTTKDVINGVYYTKVKKTNMDIHNIENAKIEKAKNSARQRYYRKYKCASEPHGFDEGWDAAIRYAKKIANTFDVCSICGRLISDNQADQGKVHYGKSFGEVYCEKCYQKYANS